MSHVSRRGALLGGAALLTAAVVTNPEAAAANPAAANPEAAANPGAAAAARRTPRHGVLDLTYPLGPAFPGFEPGEEADVRTVKTIEADGYYMQEWTVIEHVGTHVDAPIHFVAGGRDSTELRPSELILPAVVVDIAARAATNPDTVVTVADLRAFERRHGRIPDGAAVLMNSGWGARSSSAAAYRNDLIFPGFGLEACEWLLAKRRVRSLGVDTLSIDPGTSETFGTHLALLGADRYGIENLANLDRLPATGARITVGLIPYVNGSGGQARVLATW